MKVNKNGPDMREIKHVVHLDWNVSNEPFEIKSIQTLDLDFTRSDEYNEFNYSENTLYFIPSLKDKDCKLFIDNDYHKRDIQFFLLVDTTTGTRMIFMFMPKRMLTIEF